MSLVRSSDSSATSYGESKLYKLKSISETSVLSPEEVNSDKHQSFYGPESSFGESYGQQYFSGSPSERVEFLCSSNSDIDRTMFCPDGDTSCEMISGLGCITMSTSFGDHETVDYNEDGVKLKLQELERELLNDVDDDIDAQQSMDFDCQWADSIKNLVLPNSPKASSSSDSDLISISSSKDTHVLHPVSNSHRSRSSEPKELLFECAALISEGNTEAASTIISKLRQMVSIQGDPPQRIAAYMVEGLAARIATSGQGLYKALKCKEPPTTDRLSAMQILFEICPCFKFGFIAANGAISDVVKDEEKVHIIDFDINQGSQYITLIQDLASRPGKSPHVRITGVDDPESVQRSIGGLKIIGQRLKQLAGEVGLPFEFRAIAVKTEDVTPEMLDCRFGEVLAVNFAFQLHHMPDESVSTVNQRDQLLRMVKSLRPKLVTVVEQDVNTNTAPFFPRFVEAYNYYSAVFESLDATLPRESMDRMNVERHCLARDIVNIVACEGEDRIERYELAGKWRARMTMAGFKSCPLSNYVNGAIRALLKQYCNRYKLKEERGSLHFGWEDKILVVASAWR